MSDPKYNKYAGTVRFDDDNIVDIDLQPDTENITVRLNGSEVTGGSELPEVDSEDNGKVLTVVTGEWAAATPAAPPAELPEVTSSDNGNVLTVVSGHWAKAAPAGDVKPTYYIAQAESAPADAPALPEGYEWTVNNSYVLVDQTTQSVLSLAQVQALDLGEFYVADNIHVSEGAERSSVPVSLIAYNGFDPESPADGVITRLFTCVTGENYYLTVGWELVVSNESEG